MTMDTFITRIIKTFKTGPESFNREYGLLYDELRPEFFAFMKSRFSSATTEMLEEAFQDARRQSSHKARRK